MHTWLKLTLICTFFGPLGAWGDPSPLTHAQSAYLESCGGCHGIQGISARDLVPDLRGRVGFFLCTDAGREYIVRLPNVAFAARSDSELAALLNFVAFGLGGDSAPSSARPYTPAEIHALRAASAFITNVRARRRTVVQELSKVCSSASTLVRPGQAY